MNEKDEKNLKKEYKKGLTYKELCQKYNITHNQLIVFIRKNKLTRSKSKINKGNKNAIGNKGGAPPKNKNAVVTGVYEDIMKDFLSEEEKIIYDNESKIDIEDEIQREISYLKIRERRIFKRIEKKMTSRKDMSVASSSSTKSKFAHSSVPNTTTHTILEPNLEIIQRLEEALTRVQETKRRYIEILDKYRNGKQNQENEAEKALANAKSILVKIKEVADNDTGE